MRKLNRIVNHFEEYFAAITLLFTSLLVFLQAVLRYVFNSSLYWSDEVARYLIIWFIFVGASIAVREKAHATVDAVTILLSPKLQKIVSIIAYLLGVAFCIIIIWSGMKNVLNVHKFNSVTPSLGISMVIPYLALPIGGLLMLVRFLQLLFEDIITFNVKKDKALRVNNEEEKI